MIHTKPLSGKQNPNFPSRTFRLSRDADLALQRLSHDASDFAGRTVSDSAIVRALIRHADHQGPAWSDVLFLLVEKELKSGVMWGKKK
jgi:hypothetical protein